jgi:hypothetical protein
MHLVKLIRTQSFRDYTTVEELFALRPTEEEPIIEIYWKKDLLNKPFYLSQSSGRSEKIETADAFSVRHRNLGLRAGFPIPPTIHDWRAEGLFLTSIDLPSALLSIVCILTILISRQVLLGR